MKYPSNKLTVVFRNDCPLIPSSDSLDYMSVYRSVQLTLTNEQLSELYMDNEETVSRCWIEPVAKENTK
jgi:hypothetical protein